MNNSELINKIRKFVIKEARGVKTISKDLGKVTIAKKLEYGHATLVLAVPDEWIDIQTLADLEEIS